MELETGEWMVVCGASWGRGGKLARIWSKERDLSFNVDRGDDMSYKQANSNAEWLMVVVGKGKVKLSLLTLPLTILMASFIPCTALSSYSLSPPVCRPPPHKHAIYLSFNVSAHLISSAMSLFVNSSSRASYPRHTCKFCKWKFPLSVSVCSAWLHKYLKKPTEMREAHFTPLRRCVFIWKFNSKTKSVKSWHYLSVNIRGRWFLLTAQRLCVLKC